MDRKILIIKRRREPTHNLDGNMPKEEEKGTATEEVEETSKADAGDSEEKSDDEAQDTENKIDYKAEFEKERANREKAEKVIAENAFKSREKKRKEKDDEVIETDEDKPLTGRELQKILAEERQQTEKVLQSSRALEIATRMTGSEDERNLMLEIHKNRTFPSHFSLEEQLEEAYIITNKKRIIGENKELKRALSGKDGVNKNAATSHKEALKAGEPTLSAIDRQVITQAGFEWNGTTRQYEKKLPNGSLLVRDSKTKLTRVIKAK